MRNHTMRACVYPGSFDPFTNGHLDIVFRAAYIFDKVVILISANSAKGARFVPAEAMKDAIERTTESLRRIGFDIAVDILKPGQTVIDYMSNHREDLGNCMNIVRGIRDAADAQEEMRLADQYTWFSHDIRFEFIPFIAKPEHRSVSSSLVREMYKYVELDNMPVPKPVYDLIVSKEA